MLDIRICGGLPYQDGIWSLLGGDDESIADGLQVGRCFYASNSEE